jgi:hypothetical protein
VLKLRLSIIALTFTSKIWQTNSSPSQEINKKILMRAASGLGATKE